MVELLELINLEQFHSKERKRMRERKRKKGISSLHIPFSLYQAALPLRFADLSTVLSPVGRAFSNSQIAYLLTTCIDNR